MTRLRTHIGVLVTRPQLTVVLAEVAVSGLIYWLIYRGGIPMDTVTRPVLFFLAAAVLQLASVVAVAFVTSVQPGSAWGLSQFVLLSIPGTILSQFREATTDPIDRVVFHFTSSWPLAQLAEFVVVLLSLFIVGFIASFGKTPGRRALMAGLSWILLNVVFVELSISLVGTELLR